MIPVSTVVSIPHLLLWRLGGPVIEKHLPGRYKWLNVEGYDTKLQFSPLTSSHQRTFLTFTVVSVLGTSTQSHKHTLLTSTNSSEVPDTLPIFLTEDICKP